MPDLDGWPEGMRIIVRRERPHQGAQLQFTGNDGHRFTAFAAGTKKGQLADLKLRHRRRARCEDRIRCAKDTGLRNLPLKGFAQNQVWCEIVALASELLAWTQMLAMAGTARHPAPKRLRLRLFSVAGRWPVATDACGSGSPGTGPGPPMSLPQPPACRPSVRLTSRNNHDDQEGEHQGPWNPAHPARQPGSQALSPGISELHRRHRATEFRKFLAAIDKAVPAGLDVHLVCDHNATRNTPEIGTWLARRRDPDLPGGLSRQARAG